jgi:hypothetical protein
MIGLYRGTGDTGVVMGDNGSTPLWIAEDGSWGTTPVTIFDCHHWTAQDFHDLDSAPRNEKCQLAKVITDDASASHDAKVSEFVERVRDQALELGIRMFHLTEQGMDELV